MSGSKSQCRKNWKQKIDSGPRKHCFGKIKTLKTIKNNNNISANIKKI